ncbi:MAG: hypothetical protein PHU46_12350 [Rhodocyclaceae bacterium]|nr:hypothetical protein [Rhodocyclaceae bacterium]
MDHTYDQAARVAREWAARSGLPDSHRMLCLIVSAMAKSLGEGIHVATEDVESFVLLGCELCHRLGEAHGCEGSRAIVGGCSLGLPVFVAFAPAARRGMECGVRP